MHKIMVRSISDEDLYGLFMYSSLNTAVVLDQPIFDTQVSLYLFILVTKHSLRSTRASRRVFRCECWGTCCLSIVNNLATICQKCQQSTYNRTFGWRTHHSKSSHHSLQLAPHCFAVVRSEYQNARYSPNYP